MEPPDAQFLIVIRDHGVEDDAMFSTDHFDITGGVGWRGNNTSHVLYNSLFIRFSSINAAGAQCECAHFAGVF